MHTDSYPLLRMCPYLTHDSQHLGDASYCAALPARLRDQNSSCFVALSTEIRSHDAEPERWLMDTRLKVWERCQVLTIGVSRCPLRQGCASPGHTTLDFEYASCTLLPEHLVIPNYSPWLSQPLPESFEGREARLVHDESYPPWGSMVPYEIVQPRATAQQTVGRREELQGTS
jgi:hypothetical protein